MNAIQKSVNWYFSPLDKENKSFVRIVGWWELRRIPYNVLVGTLGILSLFLMMCFMAMSSFQLAPGQGVVEPILIIIAPIMVNICYTAGWVAEVLLNCFIGKRSIAIGPVLLKLGTAFSLFVISVPSGLWGLFWLSEIFSG